MGALGGGGDRGGPGGNADERRWRIVGAGPAAPNAAACARVCGGITGVSASPPRVARARGTRARDGACAHRRELVCAL